MSERLGPGDAEGRGVRTRLVLVRALPAVGRLEEHADELREHDRLARDLHHGLAVGMHGVSAYDSIVVAAPLVLEVHVLAARALLEQIIDRVEAVPVEIGDGPHLLAELAVAHSVLVAELLVLSVRRHLLLDLLGLVERPDAGLELVPVLEPVGQHDVAPTRVAEAVHGAGALEQVLVDLHAVLDLVLVAAQPLRVGNAQVLHAATQGHSGEQNQARHLDVPNHHRFPPCGDFASPLRLLCRIVPKNVFRHNLHKTAEHTTICQFRQYTQGLFSFFLLYLSQLLAE